MKNCFEVSNYHSCLKYSEVNIKKTNLAFIKNLDNQIFKSKQNIQSIYIYSTDHESTQVCECE